MNEIYVTGHKNPDTDSVVAAIAYASLRNALGDRNYIAARQDHVNDDTKRILKFFGFEQPMRLRDVRTQISDLDFDTPPALNATVTIDRAWDTGGDRDINFIKAIIRWDALRHAERGKHHRL